MDIDTTTAIQYNVLTQKNDKNQQQRKKAYLHITDRGAAE